MIKALFIVIASFAIPIAVAIRSGTTYKFAFSIVGMGLFLYVLNVLLMRMYISKRAPEMASDELWERTAGTGIVPKWVSEIGLVALGFMPGGFVTAFLLWVGVVAHR